MSDKNLFSPILFRNGVQAKNRLVVAPMTNSQSHADGTLSDDEHAWLERRAAGGFGIVETCASHVTLDGQGWPGELGIYSDAMLPGLTRLATTLSAKGALGIVQLFHGGVRSPQKLTQLRAFSASELPDDPENPRAATPEDIKRTIAAFRDAAVRAHRAGFAGVELHGAHGYLLCQFLSRTQNRRTDEWGGTIEGRARLIREATRAVRAAVPDSFLVGVRLSPEDIGNAKGLDLDESVTVARWLAEDGIDFLHLSMWQAQRNSLKRPDEHALPLFRAACPEPVRLFVAGSVWTSEDAQKLLDKGADAVAMARAAIMNPDWPLLAKEPSFTPRRGPLPAAELRQLAVSEGFVNYLRNFKGLVAD